MRRLPRRYSWGGVESLEGRTLLSSAALLVGFSGGALARAASVLLQRHEATIEPLIPGRSGIVRLEGGQGLEHLARRLERLPGIDYVERDQPLHALVDRPDDPGFDAQWGLQSPTGPDINALQAWEITTGSPSVIVAVIDSGIDASHPDLQGQLWVNPAEIAGNGIDDDQNGMVDDVHGWDFLTNSNVLRDDEGHGTHVSGIIAAVSNNGTGVAGVAPGVKLMPLKFLDARGDGDTSDAVLAIRYAVDHGAAIINASWGGADDTRALRDAIDYARSHGVLFVTAAGNQHANSDVRTTNFPPSYRMANMLVVASIDVQGRLSSFSNHGARTVDLAAPGSNILSTARGGGTVTFSGTSMAAPFVSGVAALLASVNPTWSATQIIDRILATVRPLDALKGLTVSGGTIDAFAALTGTVAPGPDGPPASQLDSDAAHADLLGSDDYFARHGGSDAAFCAALAQDALGRPPTPAEVAEWSARLAAGTSRARLATQVLTSKEGRRTAIARWYIADLGKAPGTLEKLKSNRAVTALAGRFERGETWADVRTRFLASGSYYMGQRRDPRAFVAALHRSLYDREAATTEIEHGTAQLRNRVPRARVVEALVNTVEARLTEIARWYAHDLDDPRPIEAIKQDQDVRALADRTVF